MTVLSQKSRSQLVLMFYISYRKPHKDSIELLSNKISLNDSLRKLIGYNDALEGLPGAEAVDELLKLQRQTYMAILQLNSKVKELKEISLAMQIQTMTPS